MTHGDARLRLALTWVDRLRHARSELRGFLDDCPGWAVSDAVLLLDILCTDALRSCDGPCEVVVTRTHGGERLRVEVAATASARPNHHEVNPESEGHGRLLLEYLATHWDVHRTPEQTTTWAELDLV